MPGAPCAYVHVPALHASSGAGQSASVVHAAEQNIPRSSPMQTRLSHPVAAAHVAPASPPSGQSRSTIGQSSAHVPSNPQGSVGVAVHAAITSASCGSESGRTRNDAVEHASSPALITPTSAPLASIAAPPESPVHVVIPAPPAREKRGSISTIWVSSAWRVPRGPFGIVAPNPTR